MDTSKIEEGNVVTLLSGGPVMTVDRLSTDTLHNQPVAECLWFTTDHSLHFSRFPVRLLKRVSISETIDECGIRHE